MARSRYSQWYADRRWRAKRALQLQIEPLCRFCHERGLLTPATIADHIEPHRGDRALFWNGEIQSLCGTCHSSVKQREEGKPEGFEMDDNPFIKAARAKVRGFAA